ncbi:MAG TPA: HAEPLYID family protein [Saprospiraceae bacterium]|nr:HAEPLYID family protein [Saprospiraceae bacterium]
MRFRKSLATLTAAFLTICGIHSQNIDSTLDEKSFLDSLFIYEVESKFHPKKVLHAEPLYIDLIRDLGARKGEKEWNVGFGIIDNKNHDRYEALIEYEWAPIDRLGLEVELPFSFYYPINGTDQTNIPRNRLESLKLAAQYTFLVSEKYTTSMAIGYLHEFEITDFQNYGKEKLYTGNIYNPFFIVAKRWGDYFHTLIYAGPVIEHSFTGQSTQNHAQINTNFHYMVPGTRNFIGIEFNKEVYKNDFDMVIRPQMRLGITEKLMIGIVTGIPVSRENQRFSSFMRLIYEPGH